MQFSFFFGAGYLFLINALFIALGTLLVVKLLHISQPNAVNLKLKKRVSIYLTSAVLFTTIPSIFLAYQLVQLELKNQRFAKFVTNEFSSSERYVIKQQVTQSIQGSPETLEVTFVGKDFSESEFSVMKSRMHAHRLDGLELKLKNLTQAETEKFSKINILEMLYESSEVSKKAREARIAELEQEVIKLRGDAVEDEPMEEEAKIVFPFVKALSFAGAANRTTAEVLAFGFVTCETEPSEEDKFRLTKWLAQRTNRKVATIVYKEDGR